jgi:hypothetical protein
MTKDEALKLALRALERLACLGNGVMRGNSIGNQIAIDALTAIEEALAERTWVAIDDEDYIKALELCDFDKVAAFEFFEAALKAKNT